MSAGKPSSCSPVSEAQDTPKLGMECGLCLVGTADASAKPNKSLRLGQTLQALSTDCRPWDCITVRAYSTPCGLSGQGLGPQVAS